MNIDTDTIEREAKTIQHVPEEYRESVVSGIRTSSRYSEWDDESKSELERKIRGEEKKMEIIPFNRNSVTTQLTRRPTVSAAVPETATQDYMGPFIQPGCTGNRTLYSYSWKEDGGKNPPTLLDLKKEVDNLNRSMDWRTRNVRQDSMQLGRDDEGFYLQLVSARRHDKVPWMEGGVPIMRPDEKLYFTSKGLRKFFSQCVNGGISTLNTIDRSCQLNRKARAMPGLSEKEIRAIDGLLEGIMSAIKFSFCADNVCGWNSQYNARGKEHQLLTFVAKNHGTGLFRRYVGHTVSSRYNQLTDAEYFGYLIGSNPELLDMAIIDCHVTDNLTRIRILDESPEIARQVVESGFNLHTPYKAFDGGNSQNSTRSAWLGGGSFWADCFNGMHRFDKTGGSVRIRKNMTSQNIRSTLESAIDNIRMDSHGIIQEYHEAQHTHVANFISFLDSMRQGYKRRDEDSDGRTSNPITDKVLEQIKNNINHPTNAGEMYTVTAPNAGCSVQRVADAVTFTANEAVKQSRLLLSCQIQDFGCNILEEANRKSREFAEVVDDQVWSGYVDNPPVERETSF